MWVVKEVSYVHYTESAMPGFPMPRIPNPFIRSSHGAPRYPSCGSAVWKDPINGDKPAETKDEGKPNVLARSDLN